MARLYMFLAISAALHIAVQGAPTTPAQCTQVASNILKDLRPNVDPCVDFSEYTCGGFYERETIPKDTYKFGYFTILQEENNDIVRSLVTASDPSAPKPSRDNGAEKRLIQKMQSYYAACMDETTLAKVGRKPLVDQIQKLLHVYPVANSVLQGKSPTTPNGASPDTGKKALSTVIGQAIRNGLNTFFEFYVDNDVKNPDRHVMVIYESGLSLSGGQYSNPNVTKVYERVIAEMFYLVQGDEPANISRVPDVWKEVAKDVLAFEQTLLELTSGLESQDPEDIYNHPYSFADLTKRTPSLDWEVIFKNAFPNDVKAPKEVLLNAPDYLNKLNALLEKTAPRALQNYFAWNLIRTYGSNLDTKRRKPLEDLSGSLSSWTAAITRTKTCVTLVNKYIYDITGHYFVQATFPNRSRTKINEVIDTLRETYVKSFESYDWLDDYTRKGALKKIKAIVQKVGQSSSGPNDNSIASLDSFYKDLKVDPKDHFGNLARCSAFETQKQFRQLHKRVDRKHMDMSAQTVNAYYSANTNDINIPAGILRPPFFHVDNPEYLNYGSIGSVAGHELTHGFDNDGRKYDATGALRNWWSNSSIAAFDNRTSCFVKQYSNFTLTDDRGTVLSVNGKLTLGENIADNGGIKKSFESWQRRYNSDPASKKYNNQRLPGLEHLSPQQLFFIQYARTWCSKTRPEAVNRDLSNVHSPSRYRIIGVAQNSEYFAKAFQCKSGTPMNPVNKCNLW
ncbi:Endothelin-converting enzyme 1 [Gamsiella multidivaricata]|nr:Endothelin-converting enzyme 1 [Gamsiella multidivaricata]